MRTVDTFAYGELPVLETWSECRHTKAGWTAVDEAGRRVVMTYAPDDPDSKYGPARMPSSGYVVRMRGGVAEGAILIERVVRKAKKKPRGNREG